MNKISGYSKNIILINHIHLCNFYKYIFAIYKLLNVPSFIKIHWLMIVVTNMVLFKMVWVINNFFKLDMNYYLVKFKTCCKMNV